MLIHRKLNTYAEVIEEARAKLTTHEAYTHSIHTPIHTACTHLHTRLYTHSLTHTHHIAHNFKVSALSIMLSREAKQNKFKEFCAELHD